MSKKTHEGRSAFTEPVHNLFLRRWLCVLVALTLAWPAPAFPAEVPAAKTAQTLVSPGDLRLPEAIGRVEEIFSADKAEVPAVYLIQDAHAVYDAQKNIAEIIRHLRKNSGVSSIAFEGGSGEMDASVIRAMPDEFLKKRILEEFMRRGEFSGPAWAAVFDEPGAVYSGLEDWTLYEKNYLAFLMADENRHLALEALKRAEESLNLRRVRVYNADLERLHSVLFEQVSGEGYTALVQTLGDITAARGLISPDDMEKNHANFSAFFKAVSGIGDPAGAELFTRELGKDFQGRFLDGLDPEAAAQFNRHWQGFLTGQDDFVLFLHYLKGLAAEKNLRLEFPPEVQRWVEQADVLTSLEGSLLMEETESLLRITEDALAESAEEKEILNVYRSLRLLKKLARLELRSAEFKQFESGAVLKAVPGEERKYFGPALEFYGFAQARDSVFLEKIEALITGSGTGSAAVVAGGFHRESLTESLRKKSIPYAVITPRVDSLEGEEAYETIMRGELSFAKRLKDSFYAAFMETFAERAASGNKESSTGSLAREWRDALLRDLASRQKLASAGAYTAYVDNAFLDSGSRDGAEELSEKIRLLMSEFRSEIEKQIFSRFNAQRVEWLAGGRELLPVQSAKAGGSGKAAAYALNASAGVDILIPDSPNRGDSLVYRAARDGWKSVLPIAARTESSVSAPALAARSELRTDDAAEIKDGKKETVAGGNFNKTPPLYRDDNEFVNAAAQRGKKTIAEIRRDVSDQAFADHEKMRLEYGFLARSHSPAIQTVHEIFDQVVEGYNRVADEQGYPRYTGKLFVVDSPDVNGFVHAEHPDVYFYTGLLQDMERYAAKKGFALTHEFIAMVMAHELSHVMQNSAYEGIGYSDSTYENRMPHEVLVMKRNAEYDADRSAIHILTKAGYSPRIATDVLQFLADITPESTAEHSFSDHPHPSLRISEIMRAFNDSKLITLTWDEPFHPFEQDQSFLALPSRHLRGAEEVRTLEDFLALEDKADTLLKTAELGRLAKERTTLSRLKARGLEPENQKYFAQTVFGTSIIALAHQIYNSAMEEDGPVETVAVHASGAFLADPSLGARDHEALGFEAEPADARTQSVPMHATPQRFQEHVLRQLTQYLYMINGTAKPGAQAHARKTAAYEALLALTRKFNEEYKSVETSQFDFSADNVDLAAAARELIEGKSSAALDYASRVPFSVMMNFGRENARREQTVEIEGVRLGNISLEKGSLPLFGEPFHRLGMGSEAERRRAFEIAYHSWLYNQFKNTPPGKPVKLLERLGENARRFVRELPAGSSSGNEAADKRLLEEVREAVAVYIKTGKFPEDETLLRVTMEVLTSPEGDEGPAVFPVPARLRSPLYEREKGLSVMLEDKLQSASAFQHQHHYLEISGNSRRAAEILTDDLEREGGALTGSAKMDIQEVFRRNLQRYSPYFRKAVIREFLKSRSHVKILFPLLDPGRYRHSDVYEAFREMAGEADGAQLMAEFMKVKQPERAAAVKPFSSPAAETAFLEDYTGFFEKVLLPARGEGSFLIPQELASAYLRAKLKIFEDQGFRPEDLSVNFVAEAMELLSRHTLVEMNYRVHGEVVEEDALHEPRLGRVARGKLSGRSYTTEKTEDVPGSFFEGPLTLFAQAFFLRFLELPYENLKSLARNQDRLLETAADTPRIKKGRYTLKTDTSEANAEFILLLNGLLIRDTLKKYGDSTAQFKVAASGSNARLATPKEPGEITLWVGMGSYQDLGSMILDFFRANPAVDREAFWKEIGEFFVRTNNGSEDPDDMERGGTNYLISSLFETGTVMSRPKKVIEAIEKFPALAPLMDEVFVSLAFTQPGSFSRPTSYLEAVADSVRTVGLKQGLFKQYVLQTRSGPRSFVNTRKRPAHEIIRDMNTNFLTMPSVFRDGMIDSLERQIMPELHRGSQVTGEDWSKVLKDDNDALEWFFSKSMVEVPLEWMNLSENFPASLKPARARGLLEFYENAIPALADPQRQLRYGSTALKIWRLANPGVSFQEELAAVVRYFPQPTKLRDDALEELFNGHALPGEAVSYEEIQRAQRLYSVYHRMIFEHEASSADAAVQAVQSMLTSASRRDRMQTALWILNPSHPMPGPFLLAKQQKNILFDDLPRDLRFAPEFLKSDMIMNLLTGENGILNPRTPEDRGIKREFAAEIFEHFFPLKGNSPAETGLSNEALVLLKEMFVFALDKYDQGRGAAIIDTLRAIEGELSRKTYGERLAVLLGSLGPVGVKMGQILSENQELVPDARLRRDLGSLKHGAQSISKIAVIEALIAAGLDPAEFRVGRLLGSASMKQVHAGYLLVDGEWKEVVFKVLRPALNRTIDQDLEVLEAMFGEPGILEKIRAFVPGFESEEMIRKIRFMIEEERDFLKEAANSRELAEVVESYPDSFYSVRGLSVRMPRILKELPTVIVEERIRGLEAESLQHKGLFGRKARAKALKSQLTGEETRKILSLSASRIKRLARNHFFYQVFYRGIFHADPHAGNLMVEAGQLVFIDAGLIGRLILPEQVEAARLLVKGVLLREPEKVYEGFRAMLEAGGQQINEPAELKTDVQRAFRSSNLGNLNKLLNELGGIIARQQGSASAQAGAFIKAWTQALWLMPMTPATLVDLSNVLGLSRAEIIRTVLVTGIPNLVLQPFRALSQSFARVKSFFQDLRDAALKRIQLYRASLRLKKFQDSFSGLVTDVLNAVENKTQQKPAAPARDNRARNVMADPPMVKAVVVYNGTRIPFERGEVERGAQDISGASDADIHEAAAVYSEYAAFLMSSEGSDPFLFRTELSEEDESHLQKLWEMQNGEPRFRDDTQGPELVVRMLSRLYLSKKRQTEGKPYVDLLGFASPQQEYYARLLTKQYLASLDVDDQVSPLAKGPGGEVFQRRQIVLEKFPGYDPSEAGQKRTTPWLPFAFLDDFKAASHNVFMLKNPRVRTLEEMERGYRMEPVEEEGLPPYANSRQIRGKLKRLKNERGVFFADLNRNPQSVVVRTRERFTSPENPVTIRLDIHNFVRGETVTMFFTDASYEEFVNTGRVESFTRHRFEPSETQPAARSELRGAEGAPGRSAQDLQRYDVLSFLLGRSSVFVSREALAELSEKNLQRFQTVLSGFVREREEAFTRAGLAALRAEVSAPDFESRLLAELTAQMERNGFPASSALQPVFAGAVTRLVEKMRAALPVERPDSVIFAEAPGALTAEGRALLAALGSVNPDTVDEAAILRELKRLNPEKYGELQTLKGVLGTAKENIPWMISLGNLQGHESAVTPEAKAFLQERFEKAGLDFGILYRVGTGQEAQVMALKEGFLKIWPVATRFGEPVKEGKLPAALRLGTALHVLLSADQRLDPAAESSLVKAVHVAEDVVLADGFSAVEKIKITSLPLLNPHLEQQAPVLEGSRYRVINRSVFNFLVDLINDLARLQSVQQIISASA